MMKHLWRTQSETTAEILCFKHEARMFFHWITAPAVEEIVTSQNGTDNHTKRNKGAISVLKDATTNEADYQAHTRGDTIYVMDCSQQIFSYAILAASMC